MLRRSAVSLFNYFSPSKPTCRILTSFQNPIVFPPINNSHFTPTPRFYSVDTNKVVDTINLKFAEAREEIESAMESKETVYFNEEADCARDAVKEVLDLYDGLLLKLPDKERMGIQRSMGLKIEQLKAELHQLNE